MKQTRAIQRRPSPHLADGAPLAEQVGMRIRQARLARGLSQRALAGQRYTSAYISALETGGAKPSVAALSYVADRLGLPMASLLPGSQSAWSRLEADILLASADYAAAADAYQELLDNAPDAERPELLLGLAEALCRLGRGTAALPAAVDAERAFSALGRVEETAVARYWLAYAQFLVDNLDEARDLLRVLLQSIREGLNVLPDFELRVLVALANVESWQGDQERALSYLEAARGRTSTLDTRRRASYLLGVARAYHEAGDDEAALRSARSALGLYGALSAVREMASLENTMALAHLGLGHIDEARHMLEEARQHAEPSMGAHLLETEAQIGLAVGDLDGAEAALVEAIGLAQQRRIPSVVASALVTRARIARKRGDTEKALHAYADAATSLRSLRLAGRLRTVLAECADFLSDLGRAEEAVAMYREALQPLSPARPRPTAL